MGYHHLFLVAIVPQSGRAGADRKSPGHGLPPSVSGRTSAPEWPSRSCLKITRPWRATICLWPHECPRVTEQELMENHLPIADEHNPAIGFQHLFLAALVPQSGRAGADGKPPGQGLLPSFSGRSSARSQDNQEQPRAATSSQEKPGAARSTRSRQEQPGTARRSQEPPDAPGSRHEQPGAASKS